MKIKMEIKKERRKDGNTLEIKMVIKREIKIVKKREIKIKIQ